MSTKTTVEERQREVAASACPNPDCHMCRDYVLTGRIGLRPVTREQYLAGLRASYPNGVPERVLPAWAQDGAR